VKTLAFLYPSPEEKLVRQRALGERVEDTWDLTIAYVPGEGSIWITGVDAPTELNMGEYPAITVHGEKIATGLGTGVLIRIYDADTGELVCRPDIRYLSAGVFEWVINPVAYNWPVAMPDHAWNLRVEILLWWL